MRPPRDRRFAAAAAVGTNLLPLVGVLALEWSLAAVVVLYWFELGVVLWWAAVRALFAQRPSESFGDHLLLGATRHKRGEISLPGTDVGLPVQQLPLVAVLVPFLGLVWLFVGLAAAAAIGAATDGSIDQGTAATILLGAVGLFVTHGVSTASEYFLAGRYAEVNAQMALRTALWPICVVGVVLVLGGGALQTGVPELALLVALVCAKLLLDLVGVYRDRLRAFDERTALEFGWDYDPPERDPVDAELEGNVTTVRPRSLPVLASGLARGFRSVRPVLLVVVLTVATAGFAVSGYHAAALFFGAIDAVLIGVLAAAGVLDRSIRHLTMEYRIGGDGDVVGHDRLLDEPQWRLPGWKLGRATPERTRVDRLFGTETVVVADDDRTVRLPHLPDVTAVEPGETAERPDSTVGGDDG